MKNIHVHKGPTIWPLDKDSFDVSDVDYVATNFTDLNFIVEHVGMPRIEDFCWIGVQEPNVYGGLAVLMPFIHPRPRYFADVMAELLFWLGEDRLLFASDYALWHPKWIVEKFVDFHLPEQVSTDVGVSLSVEAKQKILGLNACKLYDIDPVEHGAKLRADEFGQKAATGPAAAATTGPGRRRRARWPRRSRREPEPRRGEGRARGGDGPRARQSLVALDFVQSLDVADGEVRATIRLPTFWCSPNFAYLMMSDAHEALRAFPGRRSR